MFKVNFGENDSENPIEEVSKESSVTEEEAAEAIVSEINPLLTDKTETETPHSQPEVTIENPGSESEADEDSEPDSDSESDLDEDKDDEKDESNFD